MSFTLATLKTAVQDYLQVSETTFTTQLPRFIQEAEDRIFNMVQLPYQRKNVSATLTASNRFLATPTDFYAPFSLAIISSSTYDYLDFKHPSFIKEYSPGTTTGQPKYYSLFDETFNFCVKLLSDVANTMGITYEEINVWIFCVIWPILTLIMFAEILRLRLKINTKN